MSPKSSCRPAARALLVEETVGLGPLTLPLVRPRDPEALLVDEAGEREELLPYWAELWPSARALARRIASADLRGLRVVELGCGLALPSLVAALRGATVLATDWSADALALAQLNAQRLRVPLATLHIAWQRPEPLLARGPFELVLAADVLYERASADLLAGLLPPLVDPEGEVLLADPGRPASAAFLTRAGAAWELVEREADPLGGPAVYRLRRAEAIRAPMP